MLAEVRPREIDRPVFLQPLALRHRRRGERHCIPCGFAQFGLHRIDPASARVREGIVRGDVGLHVEDRRAIYEIAGPEQEPPAGDAEQCD